MVSSKGLVSSLVALGQVSSAAAQAAICSNAPYSTLLPLSKYGVAMTYCSSSYPVPAITKFKTLTPTTTVTVTATQRSTVLQGTSVKVIRSTSTTIVATVTAKPVAAREAEPVPQNANNKSFSSLWNSFSRSASPESMAQACSCIEKPTTTISTITGTKAATIKSTTTVTATVTKPTVVTTTLIKVVKGTTTRHPVPTPPSRTCNDATTIDSNGRAFQVHCGLQLSVPSTAGVYRSQETYSFTGKDIEACTKSCAEDKDCCAASQWVNGNDYSWCARYYNETQGGGCSIPADWWSAGTEGEYPMYDPSYIDSAVYVGKGTIPPNTRACTPDEIFELSGKQYQAHCNTGISYDWTETLSYDYSRSAPEAGSVAGCAAWCAAKENCCVASLADEHDPYNPDSRICVALMDSAGCGGWNATTRLVEEQYRQDVVTYLGDV